MHRIHALCIPLWKHHDFPVEWGTRSKSIGAVLAALALVMSGLSGASAPAYAAGGKTLSITHYKQQKSNHCWATSIQVVVRFSTSQTPTQCGIVNYVKGGSSCVNSTATLAEARTGMQHYMGTPGTWSSSSTNLQNGTLRSEIDGTHPFSSAIIWSGGGGHMVTVYAYYVNGSGSPTNSVTEIYYSNSDGVVGSGTNATRAARLLSTYWSNSSFYEYGSLIGTRP